jgi:DnaK suppressor protein
VVVPRKGKDNGEPRQVKKSAKAPAPKAVKAEKPQRKSAPAKSAPAKKAETRKEEPVRTKTHLTPKELAHFQHLLLLKRAELVGDVNSMEDEALQKSKLSASGDLSTMPIHMADIGTANYEQEFALGLLDGERRILLEINDALQRIEDRTYGICEGTGKEIAKARLEANPWARYCVEYARMVEQGLVREGETYVTRGEDEDDDIIDEDILDEGEDAADDSDEETPETRDEELPVEEEELDDENGLDWRDSKDD